MRRKGMKWLGLAVAVSVSLVLGVLFQLSGGGERVESSSGGHARRLVVRDVAPEAAARAAASERAPEPAGGELDVPPSDPAELRNWLKSRGWKAFERWAAADLRTQFGQTLENRGTQASLRELRQFLKENYPQDWQTKLEDLLRQAFPDVADQVLATIAGMDAYDEWFEQNKRDLATMTSQEIREALSQERREIFGEAAAEIWPSDSGAAHVRDTLDILEDADDIPLEDKLPLFRSAVEESDLGESGAPRSDQRQVMATAFVSLESVQQDLRAMSPEERAESLRWIRKSLGMDEETIEGLETLDAEREARWQKGLHYMAERGELTQDYEGATLQRELRRLRARYFQDQARLITAEESRGYFRYKRRRVYGRN